MARRRLSDENDLRKRILRILRKNKTCDLDEVIRQCTSHTWTQVFLEVDQMSRTGELRLLCKTAGEYAVSLLGLHNSAGHVKNSPAKGKGTHEKANHRSR